MGDFSLDAVGKVFGDGWIERGTPVVQLAPLALSALSMEQLFRGYP
jgi:hypothetical protein